MLQFESKLFREETRDFLLENIVLEKWCLWMNGLKTHYNTNDEKIRDTLKSKFRKCVMKHSENGMLIAVNKKMIFKDIKNVQTLLTEIGELFLCNIQINDEIIHMSAENFMILNYKVNENSIKQMNITPTMFGLHNTAQTSTLGLSSEFDLSDSEEEEESVVEPPASFLSSNTDPFGLETAATENFGIDENMSPFEVCDSSEVKDELQEYILKNLKKEPMEEEKELKIDTTLEQKTKAEKKKGNKHSSKGKGGKRKKTDEDEEDIEGRGKKKLQKENTDEKKMKKNMEEMEMRNSDMDLLTQHLDAHTVDTLKSGRILINENIPKINEIFQVISKYVLTLKKMLKNIPYKIDEKTGEIKLLCGGCHLHCVSNWNLPGPSGRPTKELCGALL